MQFPNYGKLTSGHVRFLVGNLERACVTFILDKSTSPGRRNVTSFEVAKLTQTINTLDQNVSVQFSSKNGMILA